VVVLEPENSIFRTRIFFFLDEKGSKKSRLTRNYAELKPIKAKMLKLTESIERLPFESSDTWLSAQTVIIF